MLSVRPFTRVRVWSRRPAQVEAFVEAMQPQVRATLTSCPSAEVAVRDADVVVTATSAREPIVSHAWFSPGTHINAVGSSIPTAREIDSATMAAASLFIDRRESTLNESGDYLMAAREGAIGPESLRAELGDVLIGRAPGRQAEGELTLFKSLGLAVEDLAAAHLAVDGARAAGLGQSVPF